MAKKLFAMMKISASFPHGMDAPVFLCYVLLLQCRRSYVCIGLLYMYVHSVYNVYMYASNCISIHLDRCMCM